ncbi:MAG: fimbria/pilus periplasmic chaperone [Pseudomonadota bacterium]
MVFEVSFTPRKIFAALAAGLAAMGMFASSAWAIQISPLFIDMSVPSSGQTTLLVRNDSTAETPVEIVVMKRIFKEDGTEERVPTDDLLVFPPQTVLAAGKTQTFRVQYVGDLELAESALFAVTATPVAVTLKQGNTDLALTVAFSSLVHVSPRDAESQLSLQDQKPATTEEGAPAISFIARNDGARHAYLSRTKGVLVSDSESGRTVTYQSELTTLLKSTLLPPNSAKAFVMPLPEGMSNPSTVTLTLVE